MTPPGPSPPPALALSGPISDAGHGGVTAGLDLSYTRDQCVEFGVEPANGAQIADLKRLELSPQRRGFQLSLRQTAFEFR